MSYQRVGSCSICGCDVMGYRGTWMSILPPPPDGCSGCGAVSRSDVVPMVPRPVRTKPFRPDVQSGGNVDTTE